MAAAPKSNIALLIDQLNADADRRADRRHTVGNFLTGATVNGAILGAVIGYSRARKKQKR